LKKNQPKIFKNKKVIKGQTFFSKNPKNRSKKWVAKGKNAVFEDTLKITENKEIGDFLKFQHILGMFFENLGYSNVKIFHFPIIY